MAHRPLSLVPTFCGGTSISAIPDGDRLLLYPKLGIISAAEQSKVPLVATFIILGMSALAAVTLGE